MNKVFISTFPFSRSSEEPLKALKQGGFDYTINPLGRKLKAEELYEHAKDATAVIVGTEDLSVLIEKNKNLKLIARIGIGLDSVPLDVCKARGIEVCYTPDAVTDSVTELTLGLIITLSRKIMTADRAIRKEGWQRFEGKGLKEQTIGLVGFGRIGKRVAEVLVPFSPVKVLVCDILNKEKEVQELKAKGLNISFVSFEELIAQSDTISLHLPKTHRSANMIDKNSIAKMKDGVMIINTARGGIINEDDLVMALKSGKVSGAALDVFVQEPYKGALCEIEEAILTQHMGSCAIEARNRMELETVEDVLRYFRGQKLKTPVDLDAEIALLK